MEDDNKFASSPYKDRTLDNVVFEPLIIGEHRKQHANDFDMTYQLICKDQDLMRTLKVSDFTKSAINTQLIQSEYQILEELFEIQPVAKNLIQGKMYMDRNRYIDILTYGKSRVQLKTGVKENKNGEADYINACYANSPFEAENSPAMGDKKIICSQGPLPNTVDHFWQMIVENNVTMIVSTCKLVESGRPKCHQFYPNQVNSTVSYKISQDPSSNSKVEVLLKEENDESQFLKRREMQAKRPDGSIQNITQIHFVGWPDHGVPDGQAMQDFTSMIDKFVIWNLKSAPNEKAVVHCSAGIGRTGTTISLMETMINISAQRNKGVKDPEFSLFHTVRRLREQRYGSVQTLSQYTFMYQFLTSWLKINKFL